MDDASTLILRNNPKTHVQNDLLGKELILIGL